MIHCYNMKCKYCNIKNKCTNKNIILNFIGINTKYQGFKELLECESFEESDMSKQIKELLKGSGINE